VRTSFKKQKEVVNNCIELAILIYNMREKKNEKKIGRGNLRPKENVF